MRENLGDFRKSIQILMFLWTSNPVWVTFQEHGSSFYVNIEEKVWLLVKKIRTWKDWQGDFIETKAKKSPNFAWFGEPCRLQQLLCNIFVCFGISKNCLKEWCEKTHIQLIPWSYTCSMHNMLFRKQFSDAGLYAYFNMGRHYICHYFTPSEREV